MFEKYALRRPFSRKVRLSTDAVTTPAGRDGFQAKYGRIVGRDPLATAIAALGAAYAGDAGPATAWRERLAGPGMAAETARLFRDADLRKFTLAALRDFHAAGGVLDTRTAALLSQLAETADPDSGAVFARPPETDPPAARLEFDYARQVPANLRIAIYFRGEFFPNSRPHDLAFRFATAFEAGGAQALLKSPDRDPTDIADCDIALVDDPHVFRKAPDDKRTFLERVRARSARLVMLEMDPWARGRAERIAANQDIYDLVWAMMPSLVDAEGRIDGLKASAMLFPVGAPAVFRRHEIPDAPADRSSIGFCGGIEEFNFHRYFWVVGARARDAHPDVEVTNHHADGAEVEASLDRYVRRLGRTYACLNFVRRANGRTSMVGRTSDALRLRQLLVQERAAETGAYLTPGEHYLDFFDLGYLERICAALEANDGRFEEVRRAGADFFDARYSDAAVLRHMATWL